MKRITLIIIILFGHLSFCSFAQKNVQSFFKSDEEKGDQHFTSFSYENAIDYYEKAVKSESSNDSLKLKIAESYRMLNDPEMAANWYGQVFESGGYDKDPAHMLHYAEALSSIKKYPEAKKWYELYQGLYENDSRPGKKVTGIDNQNRYYKQVGQIEVNEATFNSAGTDFSPAFFGEYIVFVSSRPGSGAIKRVFSWDRSEFLDLFISDESGNVSRFDSKLNTKYHEGPLVFYNEHQNLIFTRNNFVGGRVKKSQQGITKLKLYATYQSDDGNWAQEIPLPFNSDEYSVGHPAIKEDGSILYFVSDMPGGFGGTDIYKSTFKSGKWSDPINLGKNINTEGNEVFPFLHNETVLYFASNGRDGLGGLDLFKVDLSKGPDAKVLNIGAPINSNLDDFGIILNKDGNSGYFSSNRNGSRNQDDIYTFSAPKGLVIDLIVKGKILDNTNDQSIPNAKVYLLDSDGKVIQETQSDDQGNYTFSVDEGVKYKIKTEKTDYFDQEIAFSTTERNKTEWDVDVGMDKDFGFSLFGIITEHKSDTPIEDVKVELIDNMTGKSVLDIKTDQSGQIKYNLEDRKLNDRISFQIHIHKDGYLGKTVTFNSQLTQPGRVNLHEALDISLDKIDVGTDIGKLIDVKPIYFDLGKYNIRPDAAKELDKIVSIMKENPTLKIELGSHTDARGSAGSNLRLSDKRAKASAQYIISQGIESSRIVGRGYGETNIINKCKDGIKCSEQEHQENRRTEFRVLKF